MQRQGVALDAGMRAISDILRQCPELVRLVHADLVEDRRSARGRPGLPADCVLRAFVLWRMKNWSFRELRERIAEGFVLRQFVGIGMGKVPRHDAFQRAFKRISAETVRKINDALLRHAVDTRIVRGAKLRIDATVVASNIHYPTDAGLAADSVRVLSRLVKVLAERAPQAATGFRDRSRSTKRLAYRIQRIARSKNLKHRDARLRRAYRGMLFALAKVADTAAAAAERAQADPPQDPLDAAVVRCVCAEIHHFVALARKVHDQARRRVIHGESVPADEKIVSIFEPHTSTIVRGKAGKSVEFGHKLFLADTDEGLIVHYDVVDGNPPDSPWVAPVLERYRALFDAVPTVYAGDRGFYSRENVKLCKDAGIQTESFPYKAPNRPAARTPHEKSEEFRAAQAIRAGIEGRISVLARGRGTSRCPQRGRESFDVFVGAAEIANNLLRIAAILVARETAAAKRKRARRSPRAA
jgi:IS5 family transposase